MTREDAHAFFLWGWNDACNGEDENPVNFSDETSAAWTAGYGAFKEWIWDDVEDAFNDWYKDVTDL